MGVRGGFGGLERVRERERKATVLKSSWLPRRECNPYVRAGSAAGERKDITRKEAIVSAFLLQIPLILAPCPVSTAEREVKQKDKVKVGDRKQSLKELRTTVERKRNREEW